MNSDCERMKDRIADLVTGILSEAHIQEVEQHLSECNACRDYAQALKNEDALLTKYAADMDTDMTSRQERLLQAVDRSCQSRRIRTFSIRRTIMKSPITRIAAAAVIFIACLTGLLLLRSTGSGVALADVMERIEQVTACKCRMDATIKIQGMDEKPVSQATMLTSDAFGAKMTIDINNPLTGQGTTQVIYVSLPENTITTVVPNEKIYSELEFDEASFDSWRQQSDPRTVIKRILEFEHTSLGRSTVDGIEVEGFRTTDPDGPMGQAEVKIWIDVETKFPVRLEVRKNAGNDTYVCATFHDFQWDVPADATQFEPVIPDDYTPGQPMMQMMPGKRPDSK